MRAIVTSVKVVTGRVDATPPLDAAASAGAPVATFDDLVEFALFALLRSKSRDVGAASRARTQWRRSSVLTSRSRIAGGPMMPSDIVDANCDAAPLSSSPLATIEEALVPTPLPALSASAPAWQLPPGACSTWRTLGAMMAQLPPVASTPTPTPTTAVTTRSTIDATASVGLTTTTTTTATSTSATSTTTTAKTASTHTTLDDAKQRRDVQYMFDEAISDAADDAPPPTLAQLVAQRRREQSHLVVLTAPEIVAFLRAHGPAALKHTRNADWTPMLLAVARRDAARAPAQRRFELLAAEPIALALRQTRDLYRLASFGDASLAASATVSGNDAAAIQCALCRRVGNNAECGALVRRRVSRVC